MCKKFIFSICLMLMIVMPASAYEGMIGQQGMTWYDNIMLKVDIDAQGTNPGATEPGWTSWEMPSYWSSFGPINKTFSAGMLGSVTVQMDGVKDGVGGNFGGSRQRYAGTNATNDFEYVLGDLAYVAMGSSGGLGMDYIKFDFIFSSALAGETVELTFWNYDPAFNYAGEPPDSKWVAYSQTNPRAWLIANGDPNGYQPDNTNIPYTNMPAGLEALTLGRALQMGNETHVTMFDNRYGMSYSTSFEVTLDGMGNATVYSWADMSSWAGSQHISINGFAVSIPEPATVALLGLGGLSLLRRRRR